MEGKRLDLDAPLLSVRRIFTTTPPDSNGQRIPFAWEERGAVSRAAITKKRNLVKADEEEEDNSCVMSCSDDEMVGETVDSNEELDSVMDRFLLAAETIAAARPRNFSRRVASRRNFSLAGKFEELRKGEEDGSSKRTCDSFSLSLWSDNSGEGHSPVRLRNNYDGRRSRLGSENLEKLVNLNSFFLGSKGIEDNESERKRMSREGMEGRPPPLPESPSDSWLSRILPTVALKGSSLAFLDSRPYQTRQAFGTSSPRNSVLERLRK